MTGKVQSIVLGAVVAGLLGTAYHVLQFTVQSQVLGVVLCCLIPTVGALITTWHFTTVNEMTITAGEGALMGLAACVGGYFVSVILSLMVAIIGIAPSPFDIDAIVQLSRQQMIAQGQDPEIIDRSAEFTRKFFWAFPILAIIANALFGAIVGAIGANLFKKGGEITDARM